jgi:hypothetical protein
MLYLVCSKPTYVCCWFVLGRREQPWEYPALGCVYSAYCMGGSGVSKSERDTSCQRMRGAASPPRQVTAFSGCSVPSVLFVKRFVQPRLTMFKMTSSLSGPLLMVNQQEGVHPRMALHPRWTSILFQAPPWCISKTETYCQASDRLI